MRATTTVELRAFGPVLPLWAIRESLLPILVPGPPLWLF